jgi:hypothetical protein
MPTFNTPDSLQRIPTKFKFLKKSLISITKLNILYSKHAKLCSIFCRLISLKKTIRSIDNYYKQNFFIKNGFFMRVLPWRLFTKFER